VESVLHEQIVNSFLNDPCRGGPDGHSTAQEDPLSRLGSIRTKHSFTFTPDAGSALVRLALDDKAYQHIWQLPTAQPALTGREWIDLCAEVLRRTPKHMTLSRPIVKLMGLHGERDLRDVLSKRGRLRLRFLEDRTRLRDRL
jgi:hypothetical protein